MTDMDTRRRAVFGARLILATLVATSAALVHAQEAAEESPEPAVDTSAALDDIGPAVDTSAAVNEVNAADEDSEPSPALAADVTRQQSGGQVMDRLDLGRTEITGNQELPKVLYIVPWQKSDPGELMGRPVNTLLDEVLAPLDREEFMRQVEYYDDLYGEK
jgi:hypothetical protein